MDDEIEVENNSYNKNVPKKVINHSKKILNKEAKSFSLKNTALMHIASLFGPIIVGILILAIAIVIIVGIAMFLGVVPGLTIGKLSEFGGKFVRYSRTWIGENGSKEKDYAAYYGALNYLESMNYDLKGYGFITKEMTVDDVDKGEILDENIGVIRNKKSKKITDAGSIFIWNYLISDNAVYSLANKKIPGEQTETEWYHTWVSHTKKYFHVGASNKFLKGILWLWNDNGIGVRGENLGDTLGSLAIDEKKGEITLNGLRYKIDGWTGKYGMPLEFLLSLHVSTMMPDLAYDMANGYDTYVNVLYNDSDIKGIYVQNVINHWYRNIYYTNAAYDKNNNEVGNNLKFVKYDYDYESVMKERWSLYDTDDSGEYRLYVLSDDDSGEFATSQKDISKYNSDKIKSYGNYYLYEGTVSEAQGEDIPVSKKVKTFEANSSNLIGNDNNPKYKWNNLGGILSAYNSVGKQTGDAMRTQTNSKIKKIFMNNNYFRYDGTSHTADIIMEFRKKISEQVGSNYLAEDGRYYGALNAKSNGKYIINQKQLNNLKILKEGKKEGSTDKNDYYWVSDVSGKIALSQDSMNTFSILENMNTLDADYVYRDFKELMAELNYYEKEELTDETPKLLAWVIPKIGSYGYAINELDKKENEFGTLLHSKQDYLAYKFARTDQVGDVGLQDGDTLSGSTGERETDLDDGSGTKKIQKNNYGDLVEINDDVEDEGEEKLGYQEEIDNEEKELEERQEKDEKNAKEYNDAVDEVRGKRSDYTEKGNIPDDFENNDEVDGKEEGLIENDSYRKSPYENDENIKELRIATVDFMQGVSAISGRKRTLLANTGGGITKDFIKADMEEIDMVVRKYALSCQHGNMPYAQGDVAGYEAWLKSLGGVFATLAGNSRVGDGDGDAFVDAEKYVYGLMWIAGFEYCAGTAEYERCTPLKGYMNPYDGYYGTCGFSHLDIGDETCGANLDQSMVLHKFTTCCNYTVDKVYKKAGLFGTKNENSIPIGACSYPSMIKNYGGQIITEWGDLHMGDIIQWFDPSTTQGHLNDPDAWDGWFHVTFIGEETEDEVVMYTTGHDFTNSGNFRQVHKRTEKRDLNNDPGWIGIHLWDLKPTSGDYKGYKGNEEVVSPVTGVLLDYGTYKDSDDEKERINTDLNTEIMKNEVGYNGTRIEYAIDRQELKEQVGYAKILVLDTKYYRYLEANTNNNWKKNNKSLITTTSGEVSFKDPLKSKDELDEWSQTDKTVYGFKEFVEKYEKYGIAGNIIYIDGFVCETRDNNFFDEKGKYPKGKNIDKSDYEGSVSKKYDAQDMITSRFAKALKYHIADKGIENKLMAEEKVKKEATRCFKVDDVTFIKEGTLLGRTRTDREVIEKERNNKLGTYEELREYVVKPGEPSKCRVIGNYMRLIMRSANDDAVIENIEDYFKSSTPGDGDGSAESDKDKYESEVTTAGSLKGNSNYDVTNKSSFVTESQFRKMFAQYKNIIDNTEAFMKMQDKYGINAAFAAAVTIVESSGGTAWAAIDPSTHNWFSFRSISGGWKSFDSFASAVDYFGYLMTSPNCHYYVQDGRKTVDQIAEPYCVPPGPWATAVKKAMDYAYSKASS